MGLVSMSLLYALILLVAFVLVSWKSIRKLFSREAPRETDNGLSLKAIVGDGRKSALPKAIPPRQPARSPAPRLLAAPKPKVAEIASPIHANSGATRANATPIQKPIEGEKSAAPLPINNSTKPASDALAEKAAGVKEIVPPLAADGNSPQASESPVQEPSEVEQFAAAVVTGDAAAKPSESPVQEVVAIQEVAAYALMEDSVMQPSEPKAQKPVAAEDVAPSVVADASAAQAIEPAVQEEIFSSSPSDSPVAEQPTAKTFLSFYGLSEQPFGVTPDPAYLYLSQAHQDAFAALSEGIRNLRGFMALVAESGMGKTTLLNKLMEELRDSARVVFLFQTQCNSRELLRYILSELDVPHAGMDLVAMHRALNEFLFQGLFEGRRFVLVVDEAQNLQDSTLETIRLLSDFETTHTKLLQIVLAGQPQLADKLTRPNLSQLRQRIAVVANLEQLGAGETVRYIEHRLRVAGSSEPIFTAEALALIAECSQGIPRNINNICCNALQLGYAQQRKTIDIDLVQKVAGKLDLESLVPERPHTAKKPAAPAFANHSQNPLSSTHFPPAPGSVQEDQARVQGSLTGKLTQLARSRPWSKDQEFKLQLLLEREPSSELSVADRYYSCSFYVSEEQATAFRLGQPIRIKFEQD